MATKHASSAIQPARQAQTPDTNPERPSSLAGVRQTHPTRTTYPLPDHWHEPAVAHVVFTAAIEPDPPTVRSWRWPIFSTGLSALGQVILGAAIATGNLSPGVGAGVALLWLACSLLLIGAQAVSMAGDPR